MLLLLATDYAHEFDLSKRDKKQQILTSDSENCMSISCLFSDLRCKKECSLTQTLEILSKIPEFNCSQTKFVEIILVLRSFRD